MQRSGQKETIVEFEGIFSPSSLNMFVFFGTIGVEVVEFPITTVLLGHNELSNRLGMEWAIGAYTY